MDVFTVVLLILSATIQPIPALSRYVVYSLSRRVPGPNECLVASVFPSATGYVITQRFTVTALTVGGKQEEV